MGRRKPDRTRDHLHRDRRKRLLLRTAGGSLSSATGQGESKRTFCKPASRLLASAWTSRVLAPHERQLHTFEKLRFIERLAQKTDCPGVHRSLANPVMREGSNENDRHA